MRYQQPSIASAVEKLLRANVSEIIVMPLYPHYASATTGSIYEEVMRVLSKEWTIPALRFINSFPDHPEMIKLYADNARKFDLASYDHVLFSYHGVPLRQLTKGDKSGAHCQVKADCCSSICPENQFCYSAQTYATTRALVKELGLQEGQYTHCFQSRLGKTPWTQPYTSVVLQELAAKGKKNMLVFSPSFVSDCLETTIEIGMEYAEEWHELGGNQLQLVESLNDNPIWMDLVTKLITKSSAFNI
jgi:ferrochelatase